MFGLFVIGAIIGMVVLQDNESKKFVNPAQFRVPALQENQSLTPSFDPGIIAGTKERPSLPNASEAKAIEASMGKATFSDQSQSTNSVKRSRKVLHDDDSEDYRSAAPKQPATSRQQPNKLLDDLM